MKKTALTVLAMATLSLALFAAGTQEPKMTITVDSTKTFQEIEHFGASAAWWAQAVGTWPDDKVSAIVDLLFDKTKGIGLNLIRYNIGGGKADTQIPDPWRSAESPLTPDGRLDWARDAAAVHVVDEAVKRGAGVLLFSNSPPASMTVTGHPTGNKKATNLRPDQQTAFARFLADCTVSLSGERHWPVVAVSPINEPQWDWQPSKGQEGSYYDADDAYGLLKAVVGEFHRRGLSTPISAIDSGEWKLVSNIKFLTKIWDDPELRQALGHFAVHSYWSDSDDRAAFQQLAAARYPGLRLWQTEWTEMKGGRDTGMDSALVLARTVQEDMVVGNVSSWQYWIAVSKYDFRDGLIYVNEDSQSFEPTKRLWVLGQWSRFVAAGAHRIGATVAAETDDAVSAFQNPDGSVVVVVDHRGTEALPLELKLTDRFTSVEAWVTSAQRNLERVYTGPATVLSLEARSVTTVVFRH